mgnify:FL=1
MFISTVIGNIGADAQVKNKDGKEFIVFRVAHNEVWTDQAGTQHSTTIWVDCIMNGKPKVTEFLKAGTQVAVIGSTTLRTYSSEKQRAIVAGATIRVDSVQLLGGQTDDVPRRLYDDNGAMHDVHKAYYSDVKGCKLQSQRGDRFNVDANGWITKEAPAPDAAAQAPATDQSQQNADGSPSQIY